MQELYNQIQASTNPLEIIYLSDKFLNTHLIGFIMLMFLKGETLLSLGKYNDALSVFKQILDYDNNTFTGRAHNSIGFCYSLINEPKKANSEFKKAHEYSDEQSLLLNSAILNVATYYSKSNQKENTFKIFKELYSLDPYNILYDNVHISFLTLASNPEELIHIYDKSIDENYTPNINVLFAKGDALVNLERFDDAIPVFKEILKYRNNNDTEIAGKTHTALGICYFRKNELNEALSEFEKTREYSDDSLVLYNLASTYTLLNQKEKALEVYKEVFRREPYNKEVKKIIELLELELNRENPIKDIPFNSIEDAFMQADIYSARNEYEKAIEVYDFITDAMPEEPPAWNKKGVAYYQLGKFDQAMNCFDKALEYQPMSAPAMFYKSRVYMNRGNYERAEEMIVKALRIMPNNTEFLNHYGFILNKFGRYKEAIDIANEELSIDPDSYQTYTNKAYALEKLNRFEEALECYDKALKINPNFFEAWYNKTYALEKMNRFEEALECYDKALKINHNIVDVWINKANALKQLKGLDEALKCYNEALTHFPNNPNILQSISVIYAINGDMDNAVKYIKEAQKYSGL